MKLGTDAYREWGRVYLGHTRLSIVDLSPQGRNPMASSNGMVFVLLNGEIYNCEELRQHPSIRGREFRSRSDAQVVAELWAELGPQALSLLDGMFALCVWSAETAQVFVARDRLGIKPVYWAQKAGAVAFASEITPLLDLLKIHAKPNFAAATSYLMHGTQVDGSTLFDSVREVDPATLLTISLDGSVTQTTWWAPTEASESWTTGDLGQQLDLALGRSINSALPTDVRFGAFLSGGIDSGLVTSVAASVRSDFPTFCVSFEEAGFNEATEAEHVANSFGLDFMSVSQTREGFLRAWPTVIAALEDLRAGPSVQNMLASQLASSHVKVCLSGTGGDELWGGYVWRYGANPSFQSWYASNCRGFALEDLGVHSHEYAMEARRDFRALWHNIDAPTDLDRFLLADIRVFLRGLLLVEDKLSMRWSLETRPALLTNQLIDLALSVPGDLKVAKGLGKLPLRDALTRLSGSGGAVKKGFVAPLRDWMPPDALARALGRDSPVFELVNRNKVLGSGELTAHQIWIALSLHHWFGIFT